MLKEISVALLCALFSSYSYAGSTNQLILKFQPAAEPGKKHIMSFSDTDRFSALAGEPIRLQRAMSGDGYVLELSRSVSNEEAERIAERIAQASDVEFVEPDGKRFIRFVPTDDGYPSQWTLNDAGSVYAGAGDIRAEAAWDISRGASSVVVAVLDTGHSLHQDIDESRILPGYDFITDVATANDGDGRDDDPTDPGDYTASFSSSWHGLLIEGIIGAHTDNNIDADINTITSIAGVDHSASILPVRVLGSGGGFTSDIVDAMRWAAGIAVTGARNNANPAKVINLSVGSNDPCSNAEQSAIDDVVGRGAVVVISAGNEAVNVSTSAPANCSNVIAVGATDRAGGLASIYSNYGDLIDVSAPGGDELNKIPVLYNSGVTVAGADMIAEGIGTSISAAHVSGVVSLMLSVKPTLTPAQTESILKSSARVFPAGSTCNTSICGDGIVNAAAAVTSAVSFVPPATSTGGGGSSSGGGSFGWFGLLAVLLAGVRRKVKFTCIDNAGIP